MNLAPRLSTCSLAAGRTSVAVTMAPSRRAVAIAWRPATPTPITKTFAAGRVAAAALIIGKARADLGAPTVTPPGPAGEGWVGGTHLESPGGVRRDRSVG